MRNPVRYVIAAPPSSTRSQLLARVIVFFAVGALGVSFSGVFASLFLLLPIAAALRVSARSPARYPDEDGPWIVNALRWFAAAAAWTALIAERLPTRAPDETLKLEIDVTARPTAATAMRRLIAGLPSALVLGVLGIFGTFVWLWAALTILVTRRIGSRSFWYLSGLQRWSVWLLAYQASLVDAYPPFSLGAQTTHREEPPFAPVAIHPPLS